MSRAFLFGLLLVFAASSNAAEPPPAKPLAPDQPAGTTKATPAPTKIPPDKEELPNWREDLKLFDIDELLKLTDADRAAGKTPYRKVLEAKAMTAERLVKSTLLRNWIGEVDPLQFSLELEAFKAQRDAELDLARTREERLECRQLYFDSVKVTFRKVDSLFRSETKGGDGPTYYKFRYEMLRAKAEWMVEAGENR